jgi:hypothetical protein
MARNSSFRRLASSLSAKSCAFWTAIAPMSVFFGRPVRLAPVHAERAERLVATHRREREAADERRPVGVVRHVRVRVDVLDDDRLARRDRPSRHAHVGAEALPLPEWADRVLLGVVHLLSVGEDDHGPVGADELAGDATERAQHVVQTEGLRQLAARGHERGRLVKALLERRACRLRFALCRALRRHVDDDDAQAGDLAVGVEERIPLLDEHALRARVGGRGPDDLDVAHGAPGAEDLLRDRVDRVRERRDDLARRPADVRLDREPVDLREPIVDPHVAERAIENAEPDRRVAIRRLEILECRAAASVVRGISAVAAAHGTAAYRSVLTR